MHEKAIKVRQASQNTKEQGFQQRDRTVGLRMSTKKRHKSEASVEQGKEKESGGNALSLRKRCIF